MRTMFIRPMRFSSCSPPIDSPPAGIKSSAGRSDLTSSAVQQQLGVDQPDFGVPSPIWTPAQVVSIQRSCCSQSRGQVAVHAREGSRLLTSTLTRVKGAVESSWAALEIVDSGLSTGTSDSPTPSPTAKPQLSSSSATTACPTMSHPSTFHEHDHPSGDVHVDKATVPHVLRAHSKPFSGFGPDRQRPSSQPLSCRPGDLVQAPWGQWHR